MRPVSNLNPNDVARTWWTIWGAMNVSLVMLAVALHFALPAGEPPAGAPPAAFDTALSLVAAGIGITALALRRYLVSDPRIRSAAEKIAAQSARELREFLFFGRMQGAFIVPLALHEAVGLIGFILAFVHREPTRAWPFLAAALVMNLLATPRPLALLARARELCPQFAALALILALGAACSFRGGDFTPMKTEPETPCLKEANEICKEKLKSADIGNCVAREKYRCELQEQEDREKEKPATP